MKTLLLILLSLATAQAKLIDLGSDPAITNQIFKYESGNMISFFDEGRVVPYFDGQWHDAHGWISLFGSLNGGTYFNTDLFTYDPTGNANIWWNFGDTGFSLRYIEVNNTWYRVGQGRVNPFEGYSVVNVGDGSKIDSIAFYGRTPWSRVPETGGSGLLFAIALFIISFLSVKTRNIKGVTWTTQQQKQ